MALPPMRLPIAVTFGATIMAWRAEGVAPPYSKVQTEMSIWLALGLVLLAAGVFWELIGWYHWMDQRFLPEQRLSKQHPDFCLPRIRL